MLSEGICINPVRAVWSVISEQEYKKTPASLINKCEKYFHKSVSGVIMIDGVIAGDRLSPGRIRP
jgi:hypothetical protein